ncbi:MAG TPA: hypothetical protein H9880_01605 [Candidatus Anaerobutyricum avicola]|nr:hypothetical protein [Candidatus Anaerobutyricum avicola]
MDERYSRYRQIIRDFTLMSDTFMRNVCREKECVEHILQVIMGQVGLRVVESVVQSDYKNMQGRRRDVQRGTGGTCEPVKGDSERS